jgi:hypothetical protein
MIASERDRRVLELAIVGLVAALALCWLAWDSWRYPEPLPDWTVEPLRDGRAVCPVEFPVLMRVDYEREVATCATAE